MFAIRAHATIVPLSFNNPLRDATNPLGVSYRCAAVLLDNQAHVKRRDSKLKSDRAPHIVDLGRHWLQIADPTED